MAAVTLLAAAVTVDLLMDPTPHPFAGTWYDVDGRPVPDNDPFVLDVSRGVGHCGWQSSIFLLMSWPAGKRLHAPILMTFDTVHEYIRDPEGVVAPELAEQFDAHTSLPDDARPTGYHRGEWHLFVSPSEADRYIYLAGEDTVERWPSIWFVPNARESGDLLLCA